MRIHYPFLKYKINLEKTSTDRNAIMVMTILVLEVKKSRLILLINPFENDSHENHN
jgi:hypothetical protein